jgi:hypothetical protein
VLDATDGPPPLVSPVPVGPGHVAYVPPVPDFRLDRHELTGPALTLPAEGPRILLVLAGRVSLDAGPGLALERGGSAWLPAGRAVTVRGNGVLCVAGTNLGAGIDGGTAGTDRGAGIDMGAGVDVGAGIDGGTGGTDPD